MTDKGLQEIFFYVFLYVILQYLFLLIQFLSSDSQKDCESKRDSGQDKVLTGLSIVRDGQYELWHHQYREVGWNRKL